MIQSFHTVLFNLGKKYCLGLAILFPVSHIFEGLHENSMSNSKSLKPGRGKQLKHEPVAATKFCYDALSNNFGVLSLSWEKKVYGSVFLKVPIYLHERSNKHTKQEHAQHIFLMHLHINMSELLGKTVTKPTTFVQKHTKLPALWPCDGFTEKRAGSSKLPAVQGWTHRLRFVEQLTAEGWRNKLLSLKSFLQNM